MKVITFDDIANLHLDAQNIFEWIKESFKSKAETYLPPKTSMHNGSTFINVMPCILPKENIAGVKVVSRFPDRIPTLNSEILVYDYSTGNLKALMDGNYITALRTGAVAALCVETLAVKNYSEIGVIGFGNITRKTLDLLFAVMEKRPITVKLYNYKNHFDLLKQRYSHYDHIEFQAVDTYDDVVRDSDVIISAITRAEKDFCSDDCFKRGCLVVPIHTLGFQNCDLFFDKFVVDDIGHVQGFKYYNEFKQVTELTDILTGKMPGRVNNNERIMAYCIGIAIHDMYFSNKIYEALESVANEISLNPPTEKYWA
jgi:alanine dehydrogenase